MVFSSLTFLLLFLPLVLFVYFLVPDGGKNLVLFLFSLVFYAWGEPVYVGLMIFSTVLDYACGRAVEALRGSGKAKVVILVSVSANLGMLCLFKYSDFLIQTINTWFSTSIPQPHLPLPVGISFYIFQTMSYTIDVYRGEVKAQKNILSFGTYVALFPQLIAGPIVRYQTIADQIDKRTHSFDQFGEGVRRFVCGLGKKVLLANNIGLLWDTVSKSGLGSVSMFTAWLGIMAFAFQIYFDFSGYSDMAIGLGKILGFTFLENFQYPYISKSITEFWRRWHISLGTWFRDYLYIPLGGNRRGTWILLRNIAIVWFLTGFWHGASLNFVVWGCFYGLILILEKFVLLKWLQKLPAVLCHLYTLSVVAMGWVLFAFEDLGKGVTYLKTMFGGSGVLVDDKFCYLLLSYGPLLIICGLASTPLGSRCYQKINEKWKESVLCLADLAVMAGIVLLSVAYLISGSYNPFLYFRF